MAMCVCYSKMTHSKQVKIKNKTKKTKPKKNHFRPIRPLPFFLQCPEPLSGIDKRNGEVLNGMPIK